MSTKHQKLTIQIPKAYSKSERELIGLDIIDKIVSRTQSGIDKNGSRFLGYSKSYIDSLDFKVSGKSRGSVNLTLSGDMLASLKVLNDKKAGSITIGFDKGSEENARADGNIRGTYGSSRASASKARDFLGIQSKDLKEILSNFQPGDTDTSEISKLIREIADQIAGDIADEVGLDGE
jgi:hypothetical protein